LTSFAKPLKQIDLTVCASVSEIQPDRNMQ